MSVPPSDLTLDDVATLLLQLEPEDRDDLSARVLRVRGAALNVGAIRTVQLVDFLWSGRATTEDIADLHDALVIELAAFEQALQSRSSQFFSAAAGGYGR